ncbi:hypothetical protein CPB84DRAFT_1754799 [Gymnopilus junonius]|uniref:Uncharacterized protein n=1 Tax=Gymnopilus junonius TaxID=109634 RepID=A0A9P5N6S7_GYMJU|nr:hypothetical protein CPB84DRAFT_1754799 [Gymnopilus junonius]
MFFILAFGIDQVDCPELPEQSLQPFEAEDWLWAGMWSGEYTFLSLIEVLSGFWFISFYALPPNALPSDALSPDASVSIAYAPGFYAPAPNTYALNPDAPVSNAYVPNTYTPAPLNTYAPVASNIYTADTPVSNTYMNTYTPAPSAYIPDAYAPDCTSTGQSNYGQAPVPKPKCSRSYYALYNKLAIPLQKSVS